MEDWSVLVIVMDPNVDELLLFFFMGLMNYYLHSLSVGLVINMNCGLETGYILQHMV